MRTSISIMLCKFITWGCRCLSAFLHRDGSVLPGYYVLKFDKNILKKIKYPSKVVVVTGSSGKGSTVSMVAHILEGSGYRVVWNKNGSNIRNAIVTLVLNNTKVFSHKLDADVLLLEMDESYITGTFKPGTITHLAITNITRDQPSRNAHPTLIFEKIMSCLDEHMELILNVDDPLLNRAKYMHSGKVIPFGIAKTKYDSEKKPSYAVDYAYCPSCHSKLEYESYHYGHLGIYRCSRCSFSRGKVFYEASNVDFDTSKFKIRRSTLNLNKNVFFAVYYTLLAYTICERLGVNKKDILREINDNEMDSKRGKSYVLGSRKIEMLESKNENALSYLQSIMYIRNQSNKKTVIMGFENVSRRYRYNDLSWLWDVDFEQLNDEDIDKIFLIGRFKLDVAVRLQYAGIAKERVVLVDDMSNLLDRVQSESVGDIYTMVCFDMTEIIKNMLKERENEKEYN